MRNKRHMKIRKVFCEFDGKRCYLTRSDGCHDMFLLAAQTGATGLNVYKCSIGNIHVGHTPEAIREKYKLG